MKKLHLKNIPENNAAVALPFPGRYPTRWMFRVVDSKGEWLYLGKPSVTVYKELVKRLKALVGKPVHIDLREFDRLGTVLTRNSVIGEVPLRVIHWLQQVSPNAKIYRQYHLWDQREFGWVLANHELVKILTVQGTKRVYVPANVKAAGGWMATYKQIIQGQVAGGLEEDDNY